MELIFGENDFQDFRRWLKLNVESVTWQGRYKTQFEEFWSVFFSADLTLNQIIERFNYAREGLRVGPLISWFNWLKERFICFCFIEKGLSVYELSRLSTISPSQIAVILRNYFVDIAPHREEFFSDIFQVGNLGSENLGIRFSDILNTVTFENYDLSSYVEEIMPSLEVTLYEDWMRFLVKLKKDFSIENRDLKQIQRKEKFYGKLKIVREAIVLLLITMGVIWGVTHINHWYEDYLADKISIYEPQFKWLDKSLSFKSVDEEANSKDFKLDISDIENVESFGNQLGESLEEQERQDVESEVVLTSWDSLPKDINVADLEQSAYEEDKAGYRDTSYGNTKVYRVMMRSADADASKEKLAKLLEKYGVTQVDNVKPGLDVPGGLYYNLYVPRSYLKEFMAQVIEVNEAIIYESRTTAGRNPPGKNKVFIWIKRM